MNDQRQEIELTETEVAPIAELGRQIEMLMQQRSGMIAYLARIKGIQNASIDIQGNKLTVTPKTGLDQEMR